jgi:hypothetical protein
MTLLLIGLGSLTGLGAAALTVALVWWWIS